MNRLGKVKRNPFAWLGAVLPILLFAAILVLAYLGMSGVTRTTEAERLKSVQTAVTRAVVQYYALEGQYPSSLDVLEERYGLTIDHDKYLVDYQAFAANLMPDITVLERGALAG